MRILHRLWTRYRWIVILALLLVVLTSSAAYAAGIEDQKVNLDYDEPELQETTSITGLLLRLAASLLLIVGLAWVIIRVFGRQAARKLQGEWLQVLDEVALGQNRGIVICEIGGRAYAIGVTDHQITTLFEIEDQALIAEMLKQAYTPDEDKRHREGLADIWEQLQQYLPGRKLHKPERHFHFLMREQVKKLEQLSLRSTDSRHRPQGSDDGD